ncbi:hypothetical protein N0V88_002168 [Collariella sp. IMI 366227]|nr:hypothetical protein N0V88_002168 [Collariella sp. IMI 366227]
MGTLSDLQIAQPLTLKSGLTLPNRLVKAAMAENLAGAQNLPDERMQAVYKQWSEGGWGLIITVFGTPRAMTREEIQTVISQFARAARVMMWGKDGANQQEEKSDRTKAREAFFLEFARVVREEFRGVPLMVTGGFSSRDGMEKAVADDDCDLVGLARPAVLNPAVPNNIVFNPEVKDQDATLYRKNIEIPWILKQLGMAPVGAGLNTLQKLAYL